MKSLGFNLGFGAKKVSFTLLSSGGWQKCLFDAT